MNKTLNYLETINKILSQLKITIKMIKFLHNNNNNNNNNLNFNNNSNNKHHNFSRIKHKIIIIKILMDINKQNLNYQ